MEDKMFELLSKMYGEFSEFREDMKEFRKETKEDNKGLEMTSKASKMTFSGWEIEWIPERKLYLTGISRRMKSLKLLKKRWMSFLPR